LEVLVMTQMAANPGEPVQATVERPVDVGHPRRWWIMTVLGAVAFMAQLDVIDGRQHRFSRWDVIEQQWRIVDAVLDLPDAPATYPSGSWGPAAEGTLAPHRWQPVGTRAAGSTHQTGRHLTPVAPTSLGQDIAV
jgi:hypothetical protein